MENRQTELRSSAHSPDRRRPSHRLRECAGMSLDGVLGPAWERALTPDVEALVREFIGSGGC